ncbi:hypothetical protein J1N35_039011 [Gossypium stocksii]|uniref:RNase H type-1 domain-containing protein n=1 Tax=Gossypium stocksii TaxID=47602 RepID=A0A9D3ZNC9_9ROSI|nr:hypothetical protein J1N35_039011 [Gossypium stocksii]
MKDLLWEHALPTRKDRGSDHCESEGYTPRKTNEAAHALASRWYNLDNPSYWVEEVPTEIEPIIVNNQRRF